MTSSVPMRLLCLSVSLLFALSSAVTPPLTHHRGRLLTGNLNLGILWYGPIPPVQRNAILTFLRSLDPAARAASPAVSQWWNTVESYQGAAAPRISVRIVSEQNDPNYSLGKVLIKDFIKMLLPKATGGKPNVLAVIVAPKGVTVQDMCSGSCAQHGVIGDVPYVAVGNPENECPECAWPFLRDPSKAAAATIRPPSGDVGADTMVKLLAGGLAGAVTNPFGDGVYATGRGGDEVDATNTCTDKIPQIYNGAAGAKFLLPALWNPKSKSC